MKRKRAIASSVDDDNKVISKAKTEASSPDTAAMKDSAFLALKQALAITPKTTNLLCSLGYTKYQLLADTTPNIMLRQFAEHGNMDKKVVEGYRRAVRRMVWLGTQADPEIMAKRCQTWTIKNLTAKGIWVEDWDDLTGNEVNERFGETLTQGGL